MAPIQQAVAEQQEQTELLLRLEAQELTEIQPKVELEAEAVADLLQLQLAELLVELGVAEAVVEAVEALA